MSGGRRGCRVSVPGPSASSGGPCSRAAREPSGRAHSSPISSRRSTRGMVRGRRRGCLAAGVAGIAPTQSPLPRRRLTGRGIRSDVAPAPRGRGRRVRPHLPASSAHGDGSRGASDPGEGQTLVGKVQTPESPELPRRDRLRADYRPVAGDTGRAYEVRGGLGLPPESRVGRRDGFPTDARPCQPQRWERRSGRIGAKGRATLPCPWFTAARLRLDGPLLSGPSAGAGTDAGRGGPAATIRA